MSGIFVRASDSSQAMEEVLRRLGSNAYILSTSHRDGQVEIHAATELPSLAGTTPDPRPQFAEVLAGVQTQAAPEVIAPKVEPPKLSWADMPADATFAEDIGASLAREVPDPEAGYLDRLAGALLPAAGPRSDVLRTIVIGPAGGGKSMFAARLAARLMTADRSIHPRLIAPRNGYVVTEDRLRGWARLMGLTVDRPFLHDLLVDPLWDACDAMSPQIIDLSDIPGVTVAQIAELAADPATEVVLVLPSGLQPGVVTHHGTKWQSVAPQVCLSRLDDWLPSAEELSALARAGVPLGWVTAGTGVIEALGKPDWATLQGWAEAWLTRPSVVPDPLLHRAPPDAAQSPSEDLP